jgi:ADP-ribose pyrophosphatase YjhB (NUDIX family)
MAQNRMLKIDQRAIIVSPDQDILLVREEDSDWDLPGGFMVESENWRESLEELIDGLLKIQIVANHPVFAADFVNPENGEYIYVSFVQADVFDTDFEVGKFEEARWFKLEEIGALPFSTFDAKDAILSYFDRFAKI